MIKEALRYLVGLKENKTYTINGDTYSDNDLCRIAPHVDRPTRITVTGLDSIVQLINTELGKVNAPVFVRVDNARKVSVFTTYDKTMSRDSLYEATCDVPGFQEGFRGHEKAIIELRSRFVPNDGVNYLLDLLSRISKDSGVTTQDNGVSQTVEARKGVSLKQMEAVRPRISLCPYRTFLEVVQPESDFILRLDDDGNVGLFEADGGMWELEAKRRIEAYFAEKLARHRAAGAVVVMM